MTKREMTEIFSAMMLAWPNAEMFKGGVQKLGPTIMFWAKATADVDIWTAEQAVVRLSRECKFPPSIAEFVAESQKVRQEVQSQIDANWEFLRKALDRGAEGIEQIPLSAVARQTVAELGGLSSLVVQRVDVYPNGEKKTRTGYDYERFARTYSELLHDRKSLNSGQRLELKGGTRD